MSGEAVLTRTLFIILVAVMGILTIAAIARAYRKSPEFESVANIVFVLLYFCMPAGLALSGELDRYDPLPAPGLLVVGGVTLITIAFAFSKYGAQLASAFPLALLVGYQAFRIPVELLLHRYFVDGQIPVQMTYSGYNFDIATGISAAALAWWLARTPRPPRTLVLAWNTVGLLLLINIVTISVLATPVSFRKFTDGPPNLAPSTFPLVWLPTVLVQLALLGHMLVYRRIRSNPK